MEYEQFKQEFDKRKDNLTNWSMYSNYTFKLDLLGKDVKIRLRIVISNWNRFSCELYKFYYKRMPKDFDMFYALSDDSIMSLTENMIEYNWKNNISIDFVNVTDIYLAK